MAATILMSSIWGVIFFVGGFDRAKGRPVIRRIAQGALYGVSAFMISAAVFFALSIIPSPIVADEHPPACESGPGIYGC